MKKSTPTYTGRDYWKNYMENWFGSELIGKWSAYASEAYIVSGNQKLHLEVYDTGDARAPTLVFSHGIAGYARVLLPFLIPLRERGYNIVAPDLRGYGYNDGVRGDFTWDAHVQNICDTVRYARDRFRGRLIVGGASMGEPLAYDAACRCGPDALACWCLWNLSGRDYIRNNTRMGNLTYAMMPVLKAITALFGRFRLKTYALISYDTLTDSSAFNDLIKADPQAGARITLRGALSLLLQSGPPLPYRDFSLPVLVMQPGQDRMVPAKYVKDTYDRIGSRKKEYMELAGAPHFPTQRSYYDAWVEAFDVFAGSL